MNKRSWRGVLFEYCQRPYIVELPQICSLIEGRSTARHGESKQWHDHLNTNHIIESAPWDIEHLVTRLEPLRVLRTPRKRYHSRPRPTGFIEPR